MKSKFINVLMFAVGAAVGSAVTYKIVRDQYERIVQEEIESVKEAFGNLPAGEQDQDDETSDDEEDRQGCVGQINWDELEDLEEEDEDEDEDDGDGSLYYDYLINMYSGEKGGVENVTTSPYVIAPEDFGELDGYDQVELTYYSDGVLEDDRTKTVVNNVDELIGPKALYTFGDYEEDSVFVRNDDLKTDFQILRDYSTYSDSKNSTPNRVNNE